MSAKIQVRRDTAVNWTAANPVLLRGEIGFEYDTVKVKIGNGTSAWNALAYAIISQTMVEELIADHADRTDNPHSVTKAQVGLGSVDNIAAADLRDRSTHTGTQTVSTISDFNTAADARITLQKGDALGLATLDAGGKVPSSQLPSTLMEFKGTWDASTNTPTLADGNPPNAPEDSGHVYVCSVSGTVDFGSGSVTFAAGDWVILSGSLIWQKSVNSNLVASVNGHQGIVVLTKDDVGLGSVDNVSAASLRDRSTHTGTQLAATISDFTTAVQAVTIDAAQIDGGGVSNTEFSYLANVTSDIQTQLNGKQASDNYITALTGDVTASGPGSATATLANSGVTAGTYDQVTVDTKGRVTAGAVKRYVYTTSAQTTNNTNTYANVTGLTSATLPVGLYAFRFDGQYQSAATNTGVGFRITNGTATVTTMYGKWFHSQAADGTAKSFQLDQLNNATNVTSASSLAVNSNANIIGEGVFRVTVSGTVVIQIRSETAAVQVLVQPDAVFVIEQIV